jgi:hypothetical protein
MAKWVAERMEQGTAMVAVTEAAAAKLAAVEVAEAVCN